MPGRMEVPSAGLLWEMESLCERGEGSEKRGIAGRAEQEAFELRAGFFTPQVYVSFCGATFQLCTASILPPCHTLPQAAQTYWTYYP